MKLKLARESDSPVKTRRKQLSTDADCVAGTGQGGRGEKSVERVAAMFSPDRDIATKKKWLSHHEIWLAKGSARVFTPVSAGDRFYWSDVITGSLYTCHGQCLTSDTLTIDTSEMRAGGSDAVEMLMSVKSGESAL